MSLGLGQLENVHYSRNVFLADDLLRMLVSFDEGRIIPSADGENLIPAAIVGLALEAAQQFSDVLFDHLILIGD